MAISVEAQWEDYRKTVFAGVKVPAIELETARMAWYCAYFDCLTLILELGADKYTEEEAADILSRLRKESEDWVGDSVKAALIIAKKGYN